MIIRISMGDIYGDGHGQTDDVFIETNVPFRSIELAYKKGTEILGFDFINDCCNDYEDNKIPIDKVEILRQHDIEVSASEVDDEMYIDTTEYADVYLAICQLGMPSFNYQFASINTMEINGYGLFQF